jgi:IS30 family transposase
VLDRKTQLVKIRKLSSKHKLGVRLELEKALATFGKIHTLTVDNGKEFFDYRELERRLKIEVYFADPYCSTQRARVENMNGLIRYYLPKKTSFKYLLQSELNNIENLLNNRPRKSLKFLTPLEFHRNFPS